METFAKLVNTIILHSYKIIYFQNTVCTINKFDILLLKVDIKISEKLSPDH